MPSGLQSRIDNLNTEWGQVYGAITALAVDCSNAQGSCIWEEWSWLANDFGELAVDMAYLRDQLALSTGSVRSGMYLCLDWINDNWPEYDPPPEPTFIDVIEWYINADDNVRSAWTLLREAYNASMYDKPFDLNYHQTWVQRFKSWA